MRKMNNAGSTMVEVLVGFIILTIVLASCVIHMINVSGNMVQKSADVLSDEETLNREMYKNEAEYKIVCGLLDGGSSDDALQFKLSLNREKTDVDRNRSEDVSIDLSGARLVRFDCEEIEMSIFRMVYSAEKAGGTP